MQRCLVAPCRGLAVFRRALATVAAEHAKQLEAVREKLATGLEWVSSVHDSAQQLMLEHDPSQRMPRAQYTLHYQGLAKSALTSALDDYQDLRSQIGDTAMDAILQGEQAADGSGRGSLLRVMIADSMLAKNKLEAAMRQVERMQQANEIECEE